MYSETPLAEQRPRLSCLCDFPIPSVLPAFAVNTNRVILFELESHAIRDHRRITLDVQYAKQFLLHISWRSYGTVVQLRLAAVCHYAAQLLRPCTSVVSGYVLYERIQGVSLRLYSSYFSASTRSREL